MKRFLFSLLAALSMAAACVFIWAASGVGFGYGDAGFLAFMSTLFVGFTFVISYVAQDT